MKRLLSTCLGVITFLTLSSQCSVFEIPLAQRVNSATFIAEGKVINQYSYWNSSHTMIYTANEIELYKIFKGSVTTTAIEIITEGGTVNLDKIVVEPALELEIGQVGMFTCTPVVRAKGIMVSRGRLPQFEAYASLQGFVKYDLANQTASDAFRTYNDIQTEVYNVCAPAGHQQYREIRHFDINNSTQRNGPEEVMAISISGFSPASLRAGTGDVLTINGSGFGSSQGSGNVGFKNADDGGSTYINPLATQILSWSNTQITVEVPKNAGTGTIRVTNNSAETATSSGTLTITYAHLNVNYNPGSGVTAYQTDHIDDNTSGGYTWRMNTGFDGDASARASFMRAFDTWRCNTGVNWTIGATTSINDAVSDATNVICYDNTSPLAAGILGVCYSYWSGCSSGPTIVWYVNELDIIFDEGSNIAPLTWEYGPAAPSGSEYDFETVAVHELGHGHQLGHVISPGAIMHYAISNGTSNRSLGANDLAGGQFVQAKSVVANVCGPGAMTAYSCGTPPVAAFSGSPTTVCDGGSVAFTDQSTNTPTSWSWTFTGGTPSSSSAQNPTVTYNTPGTYAVSLTATNSSGSDVETISGYITVNANPTVSFSSSPSPATVCAGQAVTLSGSGATSYSWTGGVTNGVSFTPASSGTYTVTGTDGNGCTGTDVASVTVNAAPSLSITSNPSNGIVCTGNQATLTASGAQSYSWTGGITNGVAFTPTVTTTYTVTGTSAAGCTSTGTRTITVSSCSSTTSLTSSYCGRTNMVLINWLYNYPVTGAQDYQYLFTDMSTSLTYTRVKGNTNPNMPLNWVPGLQYGHSYYVQVRAKVNSVWQNYGPLAQCSISMAAAPPTTQLNATSCGASGLTNVSYIYANAVPGATSYNWVVSNTSLGYNVSKNSTYANIKLNQFAGLQPGTTYTVTVREYSGGGWSAFGNACTITTGSVLRERDEVDPEENAEFNFGISLYPNPVVSGTSPTISITGADQQEATVTVVDLTGRIVTTYQLFVEGDNYTTELADFPDLVAGMYIMQVQVGDQVRSQRFIAE